MVRSSAFERAVVVEEDVEVDRARAADRAARAAADLVFEGLQEAQQRFRLEAGLDAAGGVVERRLVLHRADGSRLVERGYGFDAGHAGEAAQGHAQVRLAVADIGAEAEVYGGHRRLPDRDLALHLGRVDSATEVEGPGLFERDRELAGLGRGDGDVGAGT